MVLKEILIYYLTVNKLTDLVKLPRLRDYFASFKSVSDNFSIDLT